MIDLWASMCRVLFQKGINRDDITYTGLPQAEKAAQGHPEILQMALEEALEMAARGINPSLFLRKYFPEIAEVGKTLPLIRTALDLRKAA